MPYGCVSDSVEFEGCAQHSTSFSTEHRLAAGLVVRVKYIDGNSGIL